MSPFSSEQFLIQRVRTMQIIVAALLMGVVSFGLMVTLVIKPQQQEPFLAYFAAGFTAVAIGMRSVVPGLIAGNQVRELAEKSHAGTGAIDDEFIGVFQTKTIVEGALLEGPAFCLLISYMLTGQAWVLGIAFGLLVLMAIQFPTRDRAESWVKRQRELLELEKRSSSKQITVDQPGDGRSI